MAEILKPAANVTSQWNLSHSYVASRIDSYKVNATIKDDADHFSPQWSSASVNVQVNKPKPPATTTKSTPWMLYGGIIAAVAALLVILIFLMRRKKNEKPAVEKGGMEGMAPPEPPPPAQ
jgi:LPXTG-motif cell wall-anchored protein